MAKLHEIDISNWNEMVGTFHDESDRGAAILAGSFLENVLGHFLTSKVAEPAIAEKLFGPVGPLSSFSQRIAVAYAFKFISKKQYQDFEAVRQARNHFAHHPLNASFAAPEVQKHTAKLGVFNDPGWETEEVGASKHRAAYLLACGFLVVGLSDLEEYKRWFREVPKTQPIIPADDAEFKR